MNVEGALLRSGESLTKERFDGLFVKAPNFPSYRAIRAPCAGTLSQGDIASRRCATVFVYLEFLRNFAFSCLRALLGVCLTRNLSRLKRGGTVGGMCLH